MISDNRTEVVRPVRRPVDVLVNIPRISRNIHKLQLTGGLWNARSLTGKGGAIATTLIEENLDLLAITETWLKSKLKVILSLQIYCRPFLDLQFINSHVLLAGAVEWHFYCVPI